MKILVTGAGGFVGQVLTKQLAANGHDVTGLDLGEQIEGAKDWFQIDPNLVLKTSRLPQEIEAIIHLAQSPAYRQGADGEEAVFHTNVAMHASLLKYASNIRVKHFTSASTGTVYEPFTNGMAETDTVSPTGYYGASKYAAEVLSNAYKNRMGICNIRPFFVYGPHQKNMLMARLIENISAGNEVGLPEKGEGLIFVPSYVDDVARCFAKSVEDKWEGAVNVASPEAVSFQTVLETISQVTGKPLNLKRKGEGPKHPIVPDITKLKTLMDVKKFIDFKTGIQNTVTA